jgi:hypothetical protein
MPRSNIHSGFRRDHARGTLDVVVRGDTISKYGGGDIVEGLYEDSTTQLEDLGTRLQYGDQVFRYCKAGSALTRYVAGCNDDQWGMTNAAVKATSAAGATTVTVANTSGTKDQYKGAYVVFFTSPLQVRRVMSNAASDGTNMVLTLDGALEAAVTSGSTWATGYANLYSDVTAPPNTSGHVDYISFVAIPVCTVASGSYFWGQTWGPCYGVAGSTVPGSAASQREVYFSTAGNLLDYGDGSAGAGMQYAGYILPRTGSGAGDQFYMLQLAP